MAVVQVSKLVDRLRDLHEASKSARDDARRSGDRDLAEYEDGRSDAYEKLIKEFQGWIDA